MAEDIGFILTGIKTEQYAVIEENFTEKAKTSLATGVRFQLAKDDKRIIAYLLFSFEQKKKPFIKIELSCHFGIKPESWNSFERETEFIIPESFARHLVMLTIGTARGVLHEKTTGTVFNNFMIPTIDVNELIKEDVVIKAKSQK
jgi:hypothetical protein